MTSPTDTASQPRSMTGFARATVQHVAAQGGSIELEVELRSVNHRFLEITTKLPRVYQQFERAIKGVLQREHRRGKFDVLVVRRATVPGGSHTPKTDAAPGHASVVAVEMPSEMTFTIDQAVARYRFACERNQVSPEPGIGALIADLIANYRDVAEETVIDIASEEGVLLDLVSAASVTLVEMRLAEGEHLAQEMKERLRTVEVCKEVIQDAAKDLPSKIQARLTERLNTLITKEGVIDPARLALEVAVLAERSDISEEITRLESHFQQFRSTLAGNPEGIGRKLDFLLQEFLREFNTITSKAQDARIQGVVVDAKTELEKIREQVQNIE